MRRKTFRLKCVYWRKYKEAGKLYESFWDLEDHRDSCTSMLQAITWQAFSSPYQVLALGEAADGILGPVEIDEVKFLQSKIKDSRCYTIAVFDNPPPPWVGATDCSYTSNPRARRRRSVTVSVTY